MEAPGTYWRCGHAFFNYAYVCAHTFVFVSTVSMGGSMSLCSGREWILLLYSGDLARLLTLHYLPLYDDLTHGILFTICFTVVIFQTRYTYNHFPRILNRQEVHISSKQKHLRDYGSAETLKNATAKY